MKDDIICLKMKVNGSETIQDYGNRVPVDEKRFENI